MRIIAGQHRGRRLSTPDNQHIRPTSDKMRGAMFNALLSRRPLNGAHVIDLFCGSGALGLEALSRGAAHCLFCDVSPASLNLAENNARTLDISPDTADFRLHNAQHLPARTHEPPADLVFLDPPYHKDLILPALQGLITGGWLAPSAWCVAESEESWDVNTLHAFRPTHINTKRYGTSAAHYFQLHTLGQA